MRLRLDAGLVSPDSVRRRYPRQASELLGRRKS
jgi:hypothetical protein